MKQSKNHSAEKGRQICPKYSRQGRIIPHRHIKFSVKKHSEDEFRPGYDYRAPKAFLPQAQPRHFTADI
jgi:hypothetical protein